MYVETSLQSLCLNGIFCAQLNSYKHDLVARTAMKPVWYLIEVTKRVQESVHSVMHNGLVYNSEDEGDVETNPGTLKSYMETIQAELDSLYSWRDCLNDYLEVSSQFTEQLVPELKKSTDPKTHPVLYARMVHHLQQEFHIDTDSLYGKSMEQRYKDLRQVSCDMFLEFGKEGTPEYIRLHGKVLIDDVAELITTLDISTNTEMASLQVDDMMPFSFFLR